MEKRASLKWIKHCLIPVRVRNGKHSCKYYLCMNMAYNDYYKTAESVGKGEDPEFYFSIARDFINDADAKDFKVEKYFLA